MACQNQDVVEQIIKLVGERVKMEEQMRTAEGARGSAKNELELLENTLSAELTLLRKRLSESERRVGEVEEEKTQLKTELEEHLAHPEDETILIDAAKVDPVRNTE
ncbi:hypothetical protein Pmar_PMAR024166 [Perkinsus marinus ATCC 50983]|uniref:Uncharacterized protein n=1 Tax=Perkinsus marinus (strain ATCC 50983 / TXsc) TaxID=423536 RepID=C5L2D0_PERM5|nr:hypothetical protein Pmar_PMAR024166 [Perkinsus marinus ATCC 50983]EER09142.1 hypothetical protein Pmar_PMAR024166 [Perkinsus marinus ATCC 50983]|eukprot:XP_002777326.1 hypothetical protein Pmar_PMAR024166 [Perkinsus marinus ATCC 50983]